MLYLPIILIESYLCATLILFFFGPIDYAPNAYTGKMLVYVSMSCLALAVGYRVGAKAKLKGFRGNKFIEPKSLNAKTIIAQRAKLVGKLVRISIYYSSGTLLLLYILSIAGGGMNTRVGSIGEAYIAAYEGYERNSGQYSIGFLLYTFSLPLNIVACVLGTIYFRFLNRRLRLALIFFMVGSVFYYVLGSGKQKQIGDMVIFIVSATSVLFAQARLRKVLNKKRRQKPSILTTKKFWIVAVCLALVTLTGFSYVVGSRYVAADITLDSIESKSLSDTTFNSDHVLFKLLGPDRGFSVAIFSGYLSQGYYGMSLTMSQEFRWTYLIGNSYALTVVANRFLGLPWVWEDGYVYRTGETTAWGHTHWYTIFPFFASDITMPGTIVLFSFFGAIYARVWRRSVYGDNPVSALLFTLLTMGGIFVPANNQLMHSPGNVIALSLFTVAYFRLGPLLNSRRFSGEVKKAMLG